MKKSENNYTGASDGNYSAMARDIIDTMDAYTEHSPSGEGIRKDTVRRLCV